jgi:hypothetical protein
MDQSACDSADIRVAPMAGKPYPLPFYTDRLSIVDYCHAITWRSDTAGSSHVPAKWCQ